MISKSPLNTPLKRAEGLGSAHGGLHHWVALRVSSIALIPLCVWFVISVIRLSHNGHEQLIEFFKSPVNAVLMALLIVFSFYHAALGLQEVIEDYVHAKLKKAVTLLLIRFALMALGAITVLAIVKMHLGA